jgi:hypothetical protein
MAIVRYEESAHYTDRMRTYSLALWSQENQFLISTDNRIITKFKIRKELVVIYLDVISLHLFEDTPGGGNHGKHSPGYQPRNRD